ncbi:MAG: YkvA family protein [Myxococcota bacterium]|nr:YkvA family protein [Myxococcota bacterium]
MADSTMRVSFDLTQKDLKYFRRVMRDVREKHAKSSEEEILAACRQLIEGIGRTTAPDFVRDRVGKLVILIDMLEDAEWALSGRDRDRVLRGMAYFAEPDDMIPDKVPVLGFLDDAIMVELVVTELEHEIEAFEDFCAYRERRAARGAKGENLTPRVQLLDTRRQALHDRMRRRRSRRRGSSGSSSRVYLW